MKALHLDPDFSIYGTLRKNKSDLIVEIRQGKKNKKFFELHKNAAIRIRS